MPAYKLQMQKPAMQAAHDLRSTYADCASGLSVRHLLKKNNERRSVLESAPMAGFVTYLRVSTKRQGDSGLGLEAQRAAVASYGTPIREFVEVESGGKNDRPKLEEAFRLCRLYGARLVVAKLDRLSRDAGFLMGLERAGISFTCADMPEANEMVVGIMAVVAQAERRMISVRTKAALAAAKARGTVLGGDRGGCGSDAGRERAWAATRALAARRATDICPMIRDLEAAGIVGLSALARALTDRGVPKARGGDKPWTAQDVANVKARYDRKAA